MSILLTDNSSFKLNILSEMQDDSKEAFLDGLHAIADVDIAGLKNSSRFLFFTNRDKIEDKHIISVERSQKDDYSIVTGNIGCFVGGSDLERARRSSIAWCT